MVGTAKAGINLGPPEGGFRGAARELGAHGYGKPQAPPGGGEFGAFSAHEPRDDAASPPGWGEPLPLGGEVPPAPFPLDVLPGPFRRFVGESVEALNAQPDYTAVPLLVIAGAAVGRSYALAVTGSHFQAPCLWCCVVSPPGTRKTPALDMVTAAVEAEQERAIERYYGEMEEYEALKAQYDRQMKELRKGGGGEGELPARPRKPRKVRHVIDDSTIEAVARTLQDNPRGVVLAADELVSWVLQMNAYRGGKGADRQRWMSCWSGKSWTVDRAKDGDAPPLRVHRPFVAVVGGIQPDRLRALRGDDRGRRAGEDGWMDRMLFSMPAVRPARRERFKETSRQAMGQVAQALGRLLALEMARVGEGRPCPHFLELDGEGREAWGDFTERHAAEVNDPEFPEHLRGPWSKLEAYGIRLALVCRMLRYAASPQGDDLTAGVTGEDVRSAVALVNYFKNHGRGVYGAVGADPRASHARKVLGWLARNKRERFKPYEAWKALRNTTGLERAEDMDGPLKVLVAHNLIRPAGVPPRHAGAGRPPVVEEYEVNPDALSVYHAH